MTILYCWTQRYHTDFTSGSGPGGQDGVGCGCSGYGNGSGDGAGFWTMGYNGEDGYSNQPERGNLPGELNE